MTGSPTRTYVRRCAGLSLLAALACSPPPSCETGCTGVGVLFGLSSLNPIRADGNDDMGVMDQIFSKLADADTSLNLAGENGFVPDLAERWEREDDRTLVFFLHPDAKWHDGVPVTAEDVAFSFQLGRDSTISRLSTLLRRISNVSVRDPHTIAVEFRAPYATQMFDATHHLRIMPKHLLDSIARSDLIDHAFFRTPIGSGPFRFEDWRVNESITLVGVADYHAGRPSLDTLRFIFPGSPARMADLVLSGDADFVGTLPVASKVADMVASEEINTYHQKSPYYNYMGLNLRDPDNLTRPHPLFRNRALRRAIAMGVDQAELISRALGGFGELVPSPTSPMQATYANAPSLAFDSVQAKRTLDSLGWIDTDGDGVRDRAGQRLSIPLLTPSGSQIRMNAANVIKEQLGRIGIEVIIDPSTELGSLSRDGNFHAYLGSWGTDPSPSTITQVWGSGDRLDNHVKYGSPQFDSLVAAAINAPTPSAQLSLYHEAYEVIVNDAPLVMLFSPSVGMGVHRRFENVQVRPDQWTVFIYQWTIGASQE